MENLPLIMIGSFVLDKDNNLYLRTKPGKTTGFRCLNEQLFAGQKIEEILLNSLREKTSLVAESFELLNVSKGENIPKDGRMCDMLFVDYLVRVESRHGFAGDADRVHRWLPLDSWLEMNEKDFGPYIKDVIKVIKDKL